MSQTPPGPAGEPVFGSGRRYARDPFGFIAALERAYGDLARFRLGPIDTYCVLAPAAIERVLVSDADRFGKPSFEGNPIDDVLGEGMLTSEGPTWERQRERAAPAFGPDRVRGLSDRIVEHARRECDRWEPGTLVDSELAMTRVTLAVICDAMLGVRLPASRIEAIQEHLVPLGRRFEPSPIRAAIPEFVPLPGDAAFERSLTALERIIGEIVKRRRDRGSTTGDGADLLGTLIAAHDAGDLPAERLRDEVMTILLAGHDTTALTLTYTWFLLSEHPDSRRRVHDELDSAMDGGPPDGSVVDELAYTERVIQEAMRLYPPVYTLFREPRTPVDLAGFSIPSDAVLMLPQWGLHRSARHWEDPETFDPDRFRPERGVDRPRFAYFPFGGGPRHCIGQHLAMLEAKLILATVASRYRLEYVGETPLQLLPSLTAHPRNEMAMRVEER